MLKPGVLLIYKTPAVGQWVGTVLLHCCELIERPSKKDGFCFKLFHPLDQSVWAVKVPLGEPRGLGAGPLAAQRAPEMGSQVQMGPSPPTAGGPGFSPSMAGAQMWSLALQEEHTVGPRAWRHEGIMIHREAWAEAEEWARVGGCSYPSPHPS